MRALSLALLLVLAALPAWGQGTAEPQPVAAELATETTTEPAHASGFTLDLASLDFDDHESFRLFGEPGPGTSDFRGPYYGPGAHPGPGGAAAPQPQLTTALVWDQAELGKAQLRLFNLKPRKWDDLTAWEKVGYVTAQASAVAGVVYLLDRLVH